jgi:hypothetical protein
MGLWPAMGNGFNRAGSRVVWFQQVGATSHADSFCSDGKSFDFVPICGWKGIVSASETPKFTQINKHLTQLPARTECAAKIAV